MDIVIFAIPLPIVVRLHLPLQKRISLALLFLTGVFGIAASAISLAYRFLLMDGASNSRASAMLCSIIEYCVALMVGCAPAIYAYWTKFRPAASAARNAQVKNSDSVSALIFPGSSTTVGQGSLTGYMGSQS
ncbi:hypothetical protein BJX62DRAFT_244863 [Aspergillus germanicus]